MRWLLIIPLMLLPTTATSQSLPTATSGQITEVLATQNDWRAIAGLLALMMIASVVERQFHQRSLRADLARKDGELQAMTAQLIEVISASTEAKTALANALFAQTTTLSRMESAIGRMRK